MQQARKAKSKSSKQLLNALLASVVAGYGIAGYMSTPAEAQNATWRGPGSDYNDGSNWNSNVVPQDTAQFSNPGPNAVNITSPASINQILFSGNAQAYTITNNSAYDINGDGIRNNSDVTQTFINNGTLNFNNNAQVRGGRRVVLDNFAVLNFNDSSRADQITINSYGALLNGGVSVLTATVLNFNDSARSNRSVINNSGGVLSSDSAAVLNSATLTFNGSAHADRSSFNNTGSITSGNSASVSNSAALIFNDSSHADRSSFVNIGAITSDEGQSVQNSATITFNGSSHADNSSFVNIGNVLSGNGADTGSVASLTFNDSSHANNSTFLNIGGDGAAGANIGDAGLVGGNAEITFNGTSAGNSTFTNIGGNSVGAGAGGLGVGGRAVLTFGAGADAGSATITNSGPGNFSGAGGTSTGGTGETVFNNDSSAGTATITNNSGGAVFFNDLPAAENATIINNAGGLVDTRGVATLRIGSLSGAGDVFLGNSTLTLGNLNQNDEISGVIQNQTSGANGSIVKEGTGTLILSGANTYTGTTTVQTGTLQLDGSITSNAIVNSGAFFTGIGTSSATLTNNGFVAPGNSNNPFGTLSVNVFTNADDGRYIARVNESSNNQLSTTTSNLDGEVFVQGRSLFLSQNQYDYTIITSNALTGAFDGVDPNSELPFYIAASVTNSGNDVVLTLTRNGDVPRFTANQNALANALEGSGNTAANLNPIFAALFAANNSGQFQRVLNLASGDALTSYPIARRRQSLQ